MKFRYIAHTREGTVVRGALVAASRAAAEEELSEREYLGVALREEARAIAFLREFVVRSQRPPTKHVVVFLRQLAVMVSAGLPIIDALRSLVRYTEHPLLRPI